jgi:1,5-anhydro-D-fructose reductase (1,5-anhydro-D-mannitol-forming)
VAQGDIEDGVAGTMRTRRGALISFQDAFTLGHAGTALDIHGTEGSLIARDIFGPEPRGDVFLRRGEVMEPIAINDRRNPYVRVVEALVDAIGGQGEPAAGADDGVASLSVALAVLEAAQTKRTVTVAGAASSAATAGGPRTLHRP